MKRFVKVSLMLASAAVLLSSCNCYKKMAKNADDVNITCVPTVLSLKGNTVSADITVTYPAAYFNKKAILKVTPVLVFEGGEIAGTPKYVQGEKVKDNYTVIAKAEGGSYTQTVVFPYDSRADLSTLELRVEGKCAKKNSEFTTIAVIPVAQGISTIQKMANNSAALALMPDNFKRVTTISQNAEIMYQINRSNVRKGELTKEQIKAFEDFVKEYSDKDRATLGNIYAKGYASPDGPVSFNDKLSKARSESGQKAISEKLKDVENAKYDVAAYGEDWEGFKELVAASNLQDKDLVLRVISMYQDPETREKEIKNISAVYSDLAETILPQLRRSRLTANIEIIGKSDDEISALAKSNPSELNIEEILYAATLTNNDAEKMAIYTKASELYPNCYRTWNNIGMMAFRAGDLAKAEQMFNKSNSVKANPEANMNLGLIALTKGDQAKAQQLFGSAAGVAELGEALGVLYLEQGEWAKAANSFGSVKSNNAALAQILTKDYSKASQTLNAVAKPDATTSYLKAIVAARTNDANAVISNLKAAIAADKAMAKEAAIDLEFAKYATNSEFAALVK